MTENNLIPTVEIQPAQVSSGEKFVNDKGITAIKNGIKASNRDGEAVQPFMRKA